MKDDLRDIRIAILVVTTALVAFGVVMIYSSSTVYAYENFHDNFYFLKRHLLSLVLGLILAIYFMHVDLHALRRYSRPLLLFAFLLLALVLVPGIGASIGGARRWFRLGGINFQPVELVKPILLLYLADFLDRKSVKGYSLFGVFVPAMLIIGALSGLVLLQPDLGSSFELAALGVLLLFVYGADIRHILVIFAAGIPAFYYLVLSVPYRASRILAFINPWKDPKGTGFQIIQSFIALGSGGLLGVGLGNSKQKLFYLPESHTDFIFSIIGEELGFLGSSLIVILFAVFVWQGMALAFRKDSEFSRLLAMGISSTIGLEAVINIGVSTGVLPTKGLPLPFMSYGGTSLVVHLILVAMLLNIGRENVR
ncbi:MAG: putative lipid II flippase FtsW [Candidatus Omnitrophica bacterium]|nr:putative lipid II flippase FtsW [Candidatus Omnitrophota bacterium]MBU4488626.1 putative lipid II flippase FtsW [Candidatus Omnitrophota bacterium]MCG2705895.1 putative lipid II flippase FtsW [Candidatus Omnitrophota bacterium]